MPDDDAADIEGRLHALIDKVVVDYLGHGGREALQQREHMHERLRERFLRRAPGESVAFRRRGHCQDVPRQRLHTRRTRPHAACGRDHRRGRPERAWQDHAAAHRGRRTAAGSRNARLPAVRRRGRRHRRARLGPPEGEHRLCAAGTAAVARLAARYAALRGGHTRRPRARERARGRFVVERLGLAEHLDKRWRELSGGYKLRFALARALVWKPACW